ncbi:MAG: M48 family metalloprotease [Alphaproteobacteria bacterium]|nr:M48 family metalloprotease [Alphaproteobacteria bacterium]
MSLLRKLLWLIIVGIVMMQMPLLAARAQESDSGDGPVFIRDAEIENYLHELAAPIYTAAGIDPQSVTIVIVQSSVVNAFVAEGMNEFFYTGLLQLTDSPEQLAGVIAHETGHIADGHLIRGKEEMRNASAEAILGMILAVAAGAASGDGGLAAGGMAGGAQIAERSYLGFSRSVEASADAAGMSFLDKAGISTRGMLEFFKKLEGQEMLPADRQVEYVQTHPLTEDRIAAVQQHLDNSPPSLRNARLPQKFYDMHARMKAKLLGYLQPDIALLRYSAADTSIPARYARAIALYRTGKPDASIALLDGLIAQKPDDPFFYEMKAQVQFDDGRIDAAIPNYAKANALLPDSALLRQEYGHALLESNDTTGMGARIDLAITQLLESNRLEGREPETWRFLAEAWGRKGDLTSDPQYTALASYALAEEAAAQGHDAAASQLAARAMKGLPPNSPYWLRAQDIKLSLAPPGGQGRKKNNNGP